LLFTYDLAHRLAGTTITVNAFYPGLVKTSLMKEASAPLRLLNSVFGQSPESIAQSAIYYASSPEVQAMTGLLFNKGRKSTGENPSTRDRTVQQQLWETNMALAPLPEVTHGETIHSAHK
jgi:short-subunit dehydrogenase